MGPIRARVKNGRLILDEPTDLPEGTVLDLVLDDEGDELTPEERSVLHGELRRSAREIKKGKTRPAAKVLAELRARRRTRSSSSLRQQSGMFRRSTIGGAQTVRVRPTCSSKNSPSPSRPSFPSL